MINEIRNKHFGPGGGGSALRLDHCLTYVG